MFVNIPAIAKYEWHPFTISSAPEQGGMELGLWFAVVLCYCCIILVGDAEIDKLRDGLCEIQLDIVV